MTPTAPASAAAPELRFLLSVPLSGIRSRAWLLTLLACGEEGEERALASPTAPPSRLAAGPALTRLSLDLLGRRPSPAALAVVDEDAVAAALKQAADDPALGRRAAWLWNEALHLAAWRDDLSRLSTLDPGTMRSLAWEPLAGIEAIVNEDRPFTDILTAAEWPANATVATLWGLEHTAEGEGWAWTAYADGRPLAGLLSTNGLWMRHQADQTNFHRRRANMLARVFLCADFFEREVDFAVDEVLGDADVERAVRDVGACASCHSALDPLAGFLGGFSERSEPVDLASAGRYSPWLADWAAARSPPAYFGNPGADVADLGRQLAADPRFPRCVARRAYESLTESSFDSAPEREALVTTFVESGMRWDALAVAVVETEAWRAEGSRRLSADQVAVSVTEALGLPAELTGVWVGLEDVLLDGELRRLAGDSDDVDALVRVRAAAPGQLLAAEWVSRVAVPDALALDLLREPEERLLLPADPFTTDESVVRAQLANLTTRLLGRTVVPGSSAEERLVELWLLADENDRWGEVVEALLRHPEAGLH